jgi:hypothetical protein
MGSFGALSLSPEEIKNVISQIRSLTSKPFAVNLWVSMEDDGARTSDEAAFNRSLAPLANYFVQLQAPRPQYKPYSPIRFEDQACILLQVQTRKLGEASTGNAQRSQQRPEAFQSIIETPRCSRHNCLSEGTAILRTGFPPTFCKGK